MEKHHLAKLALAGLMISSCAGIQAIESEDVNVNQGTFLAAGCSGRGSVHSCSGSAQRQNDISDNSQYTSDPYSTSTNAYQSGNMNSSSNPYQTQGTANYGNSSSNAYGNPYSNSGYGNTNANQNRSSSYSSDWNANRNYGSDNRSYADTDNQGMTTGMNWSDDDFRKALNSQTKSIFDSLNRSGKDLAKQLAATDPSFKDKNAAVKEAQKRVGADSSSMTNGMGR